MASDAAPPAVHVHETAPLSRLGWTMLVTVSVLVIAAWLTTWRAADAYGELAMRQFAGAEPADLASYLLLSGTMMVAMMLPSALPMLATYRGLAARDPPGSDARVRTWAFAASYFLVWSLFTAGSVAVLMALGAVRGMGAAGAYAAPLVLAGAGAYQFTSWKRRCLDHCRSPMGFVMAHWRSGVRGALGMGLRHAGFCVGCCWLLMLVLFTAGAMSLWWMGVLALLVVAEKTWSRGPALSRAIGAAAVGAALVAAGTVFAK